MQISLPQMENGALLKFVLFLPALDHELPTILARAHVLRQRRYQLAHRAEHRAPPFQIAVAQAQEVQGELFACRVRKQPNVG